ncbi:helix-turn-helix domain-containing protein [Vallicoccus soli]|uniref:AraC family transcriptional regulator n=1 Tax=Vallicoccus soli TaxID=2339232 RepID=A0A3A3Z0G5_9ACTN|nr:helix-turn-helix domain-containing protein [Vallicoccus soli]RJK93832.1 AraC family transcriptional regulator [Vallicoccus soli]
MEADTSPRRWIERAHLREPGDASHVMHAYEPDPACADLLRRFWVPVWSVPPGREAPQRVLQYPACLLVVSSTYARFYGVVRGLSTTTLSGDGWAVGLSLAPAGGALVASGSVAPYTDRHVDLAEVLGPDGTALAARVREVMDPDPLDPGAHRAATGLVTAVARRWLPVDEEGLLVNRVVDLVEHRGVRRVGDLCAASGLGERSLQRLVHRRLGIAPRWLVQRRRLQDAAVRLRDGTATAAQVAAELGYADQAHLTRDFARVTGTTPGAFAARHRAAPA